MCTVHYEAMRWYHLPPTCKQLLTYYCLEIINLRITAGFLMVSFMKRVLVLLVHLRGKGAVDVSMENVEKPVVLIKV